MDMRLKKRKYFTSKIKVQFPGEIVSFFASLFKLRKV